MGARLEVRSLHKSFGALSVLNNWNLTIQESERIVLLGPSGSGKTTFLRLIAGLEKPSSGEIELSSQQMGFVFQEPRLIPWRTVEDNLLFVNDKGDISGILEKLRLSGFAGYFPAQLSGGMQQRVNLARALLVEPDLLILDEAFSSLDLPVKTSIMKDINLHWQEKHFTIIAVTHDLKEALFLADRIIILSPAPSVIARELPVALGEMRSFSSPEFLRLEGQLLDIVCSASR
ncbi:MAG: ABC transporter ATP-binding protein [Syntrophomonas sp.]|uniref:ABC transporter ATP-binding protein n=1 Tax=Syntrophomonas sp. TaxID=2053627 RepID=UPI00260D7210|nr:ABC transporter ATP-binding protein [Syntrophomonas sp.]MDD2510837.1 ABC transporter ATP-binding protein [Syntrophomonas sp.]MDD3880352.1 ABC transporter ATP-binding protein [Syntrophomonas sp.]MDD4627675.1 ABC transporter ATP-binding protein [Syntrophomonas sp.]